MLSLCFDVDYDPRLEFHCEVVGKDGDFLDELFDQSLIELSDVGFLTGNEVLQLFDPVHSLFPVVAVELGLFLLVAESENLIGDGVIVLLVICLLDEFFLKFSKSCLNAVRLVQFFSTEVGSKRLMQRHTMDLHPLELAYK